MLKIYLKKFANWRQKSAKIKYNGSIFRVKLLSFLSPKCERENNCALQHASFVISKFSVSWLMFVWIWSMHWKVKFEFWNVIKITFTKAWWNNILVLNEFCTIQKPWMKISAKSFHLNCINIGLNMNWSGVLFHFFFITKCQF